MLYLPLRAKLDISPLAFFSEEKQDNHLAETLLPKIIS